MRTRARAAATIAEATATGVLVPAAHPPVLESVAVSQPVLVALTPPAAVAVAVAVASRPPPLNKTRQMQVPRRPFWSLERREPDLYRCSSF